RRDGGRIVPERGPNRRAESAVILLFLASAGCAAMFPLLYAFDWGGSVTQTLGASLGLSLMLAGAAFVVLGRGVVVTEEIEEDYPPEHEAEQERIVEIVEEGGDAISRKRLLLLAGGAAGGALSVAFLTPLAALGPLFRVRPLLRTPWSKGKRLVDGAG